MEVKIKYFNIIASTLNIKAEVRSLVEGTTFRKLAESMINENEGFRVLACGSERVISQRVRFFRNNLIVQSLDEVIQDGDVISIFPPVSGG